MTRKIFKLAGKTTELIDPEFLAKALGAENTGVKIKKKGSPASLFAQRQFLFRKVRKK